MQNPLKFYHDAIADASRMQQQNKQLAKQVSSLQEQIQEFEGEIQGHEITIDGLEMAASDGKREYRKLQREMDGVVDKLVEVRMELYQARKEIDGVKDGSGCKRRCEDMEARVKMLRDKVVGLGKLSEEELRVVNEVAGLGKDEGI
jgi:predicted  nucleic acid-binding Zn-ribbon protein